MLPFMAARFIRVKKYAPQVVDKNEGRSQRRLVVVLLGQAVSIEAPRLDADILHSLKRVAATTYRVSFITI